MSELNKIIEDASRLPLYDAAYELWRRRSDLDGLQSAPPPKAERADLTNPVVFRRIVQDVMANLRQERETAHDGATFHRLKQAHPDALDEDLKQAIKAVIKLERTI